jgi:antitoxin YefM
MISREAVRNDIKVVDEQYLKTLTAINAQAVLAELIRKVEPYQNTLKIQHAEGTVVLMSEANYDSLMETLELLSIPGFSDSLQRSVQQVAVGETYSMKDLFGEG